LNHCPKSTNYDGTKQEEQCLATNVVSFMKSALIVLFISLMFCARNVCHCHFMVELCVNSVAQLTLLLWLFAEQNTAIGEADVIAA